MSPGYPVTLVVEDRPCLVVGGRGVARQKVIGLLAAGARVTVVAPEVDEDVAALDVVVERRPYRSGEVAGYRLVLTATGDPEVNRRVHADAEAAGVWVNAADDPANCSFTLPAVVRRGDLSVAVATGGRSPALASWLRARLEGELGPEYEVVLQLLASERDGLRSEGIATEGLPWRDALDGGLLDLVRQGRVDEARALIAGVVGGRAAWQ
ncbi:MAG: bifunctional precorrin-2 dehydrogenase/sirohydrochlorin ferrochelatase [Acidimicrobiia bacterium]